MNEFINALRKEIEKPVYDYNPLKSTGDPLVDLTFSVPKYREFENLEEFKELFDAAINATPNRAATWLFYLRDPRYGLGERRLFHIGFDLYAEKVGNEKASKLIRLMPKYGRWDDVIRLLDGPLEQEALMVICRQLADDYWFMDYDNCGVSLLAKWLPTTGGGRARDNKRAAKIANAVGWKISHYRKVVSKLRAKLNVVEQKMTNNDWASIDYPSLPSHANIKYARAFMRHDPARRAKYMWDAKKGIERINTSTVYPYEIIKFTRWHQYTQDEANQADTLWKNMLAAHTSGSKQVVLPVIDSQVISAISISNRDWRQLAKSDAAVGAALYASEMLPGSMKGTVLLYNQFNPQVLDLSLYDTIVAKYARLKYSASSCIPDIDKFDLRKCMTLIMNALDKIDVQFDEQLTILIISDMNMDGYSINEFGQMVDTIGYLKKLYRQKFIRFPNITFWNIGNNKTVPSLHTSDGIALVSGFSPAAFEQATGFHLDPSTNLNGRIWDNHYRDVKDALM